MLIVACGGNEEPATTAEDAAVEETAEEAPVEEVAAEEVEEEMASENGDCDAGMRLFESELLFTEPLCVPADPQRVAFIDELVGLAPILGVESVSRSIYFDALLDDFPNAFMQAQIDNMTDIGNPRETNAETILLAEPDLIISGNYWEDANKFLPEVAPTVIWDWDVTNDWTAYFMEIAKLLNKDAEGQAVMDGIDGRLAALEAEIGDTNETYVVVRTMDELDSIQVFTTYNFGAEHVAKVGLTMPDAVLTPEEAAEVRNAWWYPLSIEALQDLDADHIFMLAGWEPEVQDEFMANPLWQTLEAVQNDQVYFIEGEYWVRTHPLAAHRIIDDIFTYIVGADAADVAPNPYAASYQSGMVESAMAESADCDVGMRLFDNEYLASDPVCIPENPQSVVPVELNAIEYMLLMDIPFVAASELGMFFYGSTHPDWAAELAARTEGLPDTGFFPPNLEVITEVEPDLILTAPGYYDPDVDQLMAEIAPTLVFEGIDPLQDWQQSFLYYGEVFGLQEETAELIANYDERIAALHAEIGDLDGQTISVVRARPDNQFGLRLAGSFTGVILNDLGLAQPESQQPLKDETTGFIQIDVSQEQWNLADGDYLFIYGLQPTEDGTTEANALIDSLADDAIWNTLNAVQNERVFPAPPHWHGFGLLSAHAVIDDMFEYLAETEPTVPNPFLNGANSIGEMSADMGDLIVNTNVDGFPDYAEALPLVAGYERIGDTILVEHAYGETEIPAEPTRIYVNDAATMQILLSLGIEPAGVASFFPEHPAALTDVAQNVELLLDLTGEGVNPEELLNLEPDLILGHAQFAPGQVTEEQYAVFSEIAPTVVFTGNPFFYWKEATLELGEIFGVPERAADVLTDYNNQIAEFRGEAAEKVGDESVTVLLLFDTTFWLYSAGGMIDEESYVPLSVTTWAYRELGLTPGDEVAALAGDQYWAEISLEIVPQLTADHLVVWPNAYGDNEVGAGLTDYVESPIWEVVPAVQNDNTHIMTANNAIEGYWTTPYLIQEFLYSFE